jgi:mycothiol system anti-sigma-R factor
MMAEGNCDDTLHELYSFLDGELTAEKRRLIQTHLDDCPPCYEAFDFEAELRIVIAQKCRDEVPEALRRRIADAIGLPEAGGGPLT